MSTATKNEGSDHVMSVDTLKQTIDAYAAGISRQNLDALLAVFAQDAISVDPVGSPPLDGQQQIRQFFEGLFSLIDALQFTVNQVYGVGPDQAILWSLRGKGKNGQEFSADGIDVLHFDAAGKIQALAAYWDAAPVLSILQG
jgi:steroid delta-isomerase